MVTVSPGQGFALLIENDVMLTEEVMVTEPPVQRLASSAPGQSESSSRPRSQPLKRLSTGIERGFFTL